MGTPLQAVLQARYMTPPVEVGTSTYGAGEIGSACLDITKQENPLTSHIIDAARSSILYFNPNIYLGGTFEGMGGAVEASNINKQAINRGANFLNTAYVLIGDRVYEYVQESGVWTDSVILTGKTGTETNSIGLYPIFLYNTPFLVTAWNTGGSNWRFAKLDGNTNVWTVSADMTGPFNPLDSDGGILTEHQHRNRIYFIDSNTTTIGFYDFENDGFGTIAWSDTVRHPMDFCTFGRDFYCLNKDASNNIRVHRIEQTFTTIVATYGRTSQAPPLPDIGAALTTTNNFEGRPLLFVDNVFDSGNPLMYTEYVAEANGGAQFPADETNHGLRPQYYTHNTDGSLTNKTVAGAPAGAFQANPLKMMQNQEGASEFNGTRKGEGIVLRCFVDQKNRDLDLSDQTNISVASRFSVGCQAGNGGGGDFGNLWYHKFEGSGTAPLFLDILRGDGQPASFLPLGFPAKATRHRALVHEKIGGGGRYYELNSSSQRLANIVFRGLETTAQDGVVRIKYTLQTSLGTPSGTNVSVRWFYDDNQHAPESLCTLVGTSDGAISGLLATSIPIEDKEYHVDWDARGDGATRNVRINLNGQVQTALSATAAITDPTNLPGLTFWLEANDETTITSGMAGDISEWRDKSNVPLISGVSQTDIASRPIFVPNSNNGNGGVQFTTSSGQYLFASGSAINAGLMTTVVIYDTNISVARKTLVSFSNDETFFPSGVGLGLQFSDADHHTMSTSGVSEFLVTETQDNVHRVLLDPTRTLSIASGGRVGAKVGIWRDVPFNARLQFAPGGNPEVEIFEVGNSVEPSGVSNTTVGRFSGAINSGVYPVAGDYFDGIIYEVAVYNRELFDIEIERFIKYAEAKYILTL